MAVNLAAKYSDKIAKGFSLASVVDGRTNKDYNFTGVRSISIYTPVTQPLNDYQRSGTSRYGTPTEMQDTVQEMILSRDRSFAITIDAGNNGEQLDTKEASKMLALEMDEQVVPEMDKYALRRYGEYAGKVFAITDTVSKTNIVELLAAGMVHMSNQNVPANGRTIYITWTNFGYLRLSTEFIGNDDLGKKVLVKGQLGEFMGAAVVPVPDDYLKKSDNGKAHFLITHSRSVMQPKKIQDYFVKHNPPGINGALLEGRFIYDAFVLGAKADGVYAGVAGTAAQQAAPTNTYTSATKSMAAASTSASKIRYTLDGTDPRYSKTALEAAGASATVDLTAYAGTTVTFKSVAMSATLYTSNVTTTTQAVAS